MMSSSHVVATNKSIKDAVANLRAGKLVAFPTETVYGLGADATNDKAVAAVFAAKGRPNFNPLIIHALNRDAAEQIVKFDRHACLLAEAHWPGPLSLVLPRTDHCQVSLLAGAGLDTLAVRVPAHDTAQTLLLEASVPIAAPSANRSGEVSPTTPAHVAASLGDTVALIIDDGPCRVGLESTVLDLSQDKPSILRHGGITADRLEELLGPLTCASDTDTRPRSPGRLLRHYATRIPLRIMATKVDKHEALLAFGPNPIDGAQRTTNLSETSALREAAANLFAMMRSLDKSDYIGIAVMPIPDVGLGQAINDRLQRAAHQ